MPEDEAKKIKFDPEALLKRAQEMEEARKMAKEEAEAAKRAKEEENALLKVLLGQAKE